MPVFSNRFLILFALCSVALGLSYFESTILVFALLGMVVLCGFFIMDLLVSPGKNDFRIKRVLNQKLSLGDENEVIIILDSERKNKVKIRLTDNPPPEFQERDTAFESSAERAQKLKFSYTLTPIRRGEYTFGPVSLRVNGLLGLSHRIYHYDLSETVKVYPSYLQLKNYQLQTRRTNPGVLGQRKQRKYGEGREFESLREYTTDDEYRKINWKATARRGKPIVSQYQIERNQNVMILLDAGRMMRAQSGKMEKIDHAVNAALMLSFICVYKEDNVGLMVFNSGISSFLPPSRGKKQLNQINETLYNLEVEFAEPNYQQAFHFLKRKVRKRALIVLLTDIIDDRASEVLIHHFMKLYPQHLPLAVTLQDETLKSAALQVPRNKQEALEMSLAESLIEERLKALRYLKLNGVLTLDTPPAELTADAINKYLEIKARSLI